MFTSVSKQVRLLLIALLVTSCFSSLVIYDVYAWGLSISPTSRTVLPGGTTQYTVYVTGTLPGKKILLLVSPVIPGISTSFSPNNQYAPYTSTMTVHVSSTVSPGTYTIPVWAHPEGETFPGPANKQFSVQVIVSLLGPPPGPTPTIPFDFSLMLSPPTQQVVRGATAQYKITVTYSHPYYSGTVVTVNLVGLGPGMTWSTTAAGDLYITTSPATPLGTYTLTVIGSALGITRQASASLTVLAEATPTPTTPPFDFTLTVTPETQTVEAGKSTTFTVIVTLTSGEAAPVSLVVKGIPTSIEGIFNPAVGSPTFTSTLTLNLQKSTAPGPYPLTIIASGGGKTKTAEVTLTVKMRTVQTPKITVSAEVVGNEAIIVSGSTSPPIPGDENIQLTYSGPGGERVVHNVKIVGGTFNDKYSTTIPGVWTITAEWLGNEEYAPARSQPVSVTIERKGFDITTIISNPYYLAIILLAILVVALAAALTRRKKPIQTKTGRLCPKCGAAIKPEDKFCASCGEHVE
ncbi:MAG: zinc ribbon domain-containing protein [Candidatus Bathyarchaeia archaeon]